MERYSLSDSSDVTNMPRPYFFTILQPDDGQDQHLNVDGGSLPEVVCGVHPSMVQYAVDEI